MKCDALILCGGRGQRMGGQEKGLLLLEGKPLLTHVLAQIAAAPIGQHYISANRHLADYAQFGYPVLVDQRPDFPGPLAGIEAGLLASDADMLLVLPCDVPRLPATLYIRLAAALHAGAPIAHAADAKGRQSAICLVRRSVLPDVQSRLNRGERSLWRWQAACGAAAVIFETPFVNLNEADAWADYIAVHRQGDTNLDVEQA